MKIGSKAALNLERSSPILRGISHRINAWRFWRPRAMRPYLKLIFLPFVAAFSPLSAPAAVAPPEKAKVIVEEVKRSEDTKRFVVPVRVEARMRSASVAEVEGWVTKILKPLGSSVRAGDVVLYIENKDPTFTYAAVPIRAPVTGVISQLDPSLMSRVTKGDPLFSVMDPKSLKLTADIAGSDLPMVKPGSKGVFKADLGDENGIGIKVTGISPLVDPRTGTAPAELTFDTKGKGLPSIGSVGHALFEVSLGKVTLVPESAITYNEGKPVVRVISEKGLVIRKPVQLGEQKEAFMVIKGGLKVGERIVLRANRSLKDGDAVDIESASK
ncbi:MAG: HlyD family efflux transporter periplasmic adaptor subunit [Proteobacteria bacterium]|nr:MAG: HlyD family efflux transporter periplasmic adaptor subunit [Pseudomonadota bacterium]